MATFETHHGGTVDICHDFGTQQLLTRSPFFREFTPYSVLLSEEKGIKKPELASPAFFQLIREMDWCESSVWPRLTKSVHCCEITFHSQKRRDYEWFIIWWRCRPQQKDRWQQAPILPCDPPGLWLCHIRWDLCSVSQGRHRCWPPDLYTISPGAPRELENY